MTTTNGSTATRRWQWATSLKDMAELTGQWLEGSLSFHPLGTLWTPNEDQVTNLVELTKKGFLPIFSQRSQPISGGKGPLSGARAIVAGFCGKSLARNINTRVTATELICLLVAPRGSGLSAIPTELEEGDVTSWVGMEPLAGVLSSFTAVCRPEAIQSLRNSWCLEIFDPAWGREDLLWETLSRV